MGFGIGLLMTAAGAILIWAVNVSSTSVNIHAVGWVLFILGLVGMMLSLVSWSSWAGPGYFSRRTVSDDRTGTRVTEERTTSF
jgi:Domain of unknown function (DUF6458)